MVYLDTSVAVALLVPEPKTAAAKAWFAALDAQPVGSDWLLTEFASALSIKERNGELAETHAAQVHKAFDSLCAGLRIVPVSRAAFRTAASWARQSGHKLRAGDALHLAIVQEIGANSLATLDNHMAANAKRLSLRTESI